jgi:molybdopterin-guanine dinucleotide biosynthesis protein A
VAWDAIILAGGRGQRLGGVDKPAVTIGAATLLDRTVAAVTGAENIVIAGDATAEGCISVIEREPFGGPVSGIAAALPHTSADRVLVVACDHPFVDRAVATLIGADPGPDGVVGIDQTGQRQNLLACLSRASLAQALARLESPTGVSMRHLLGTLDVREIVVDDLAALDVDTWDDVAFCRELDNEKSGVIDEHD